jgi:hypothetical protein
VSVTVTVTMTVTVKAGCRGVDGGLLFIVHINIYSVTVTMTVTVTVTVTWCRTLRLLQRIEHMAHMWPRYSTAPVFI